jgi:hypothetical protein
MTASTSSFWNFTGSKLGAAGSVDDVVTAAAAGGALVLVAAAAAHRRAAGAPASLTIFEDRIMVQKKVVHAHELASRYKRFLIHA